MDKEVLSHLFEPFFTTKEVGRGTGLGLATIYGIVKQNGGFISAYSELGQGSVFKIYLPRIIAESEPLKKPEEVSVPLGGRTILLVEDDEMVRGMTAKMLRVIGCQVIAYGNPQEALANCERGQVSVDLLISDVVMPGMNGSELCDRIMKVCPTIKVLFMSGYGSDIVHHHGVLSEGVHFLQKPFSKRELIRAIRQAIGES
jgi:CheY-like chemotaxis protein